MLLAKPDPLTSLELLGAAVPGAPASVTFALRRKTSAWQRLAIDDSAPYRSFLEPARFARRERVEAVAVARGTNGAVSISRIVTLIPRP